MYIKEFGDTNKPKVILIHPMLTTGNDFLPMMEGLGDKYHYIVPFLDGHTEEKTNFISAEIEVEYIVNYLKEKGYDKFAFLFGSSLGSVIGTYIYAREDFKIDYAFLDCPPFVPQSALLFEMVSSFVLNLKSNIKLFRSRKDRCLHTPLGAINSSMVDALEAMSEDSVKNILYSCTHFTFPYLPLHKQRHMYVNFGERDFDRVAVGMVKRKYPLAHVEILKGLGHCEFMLVKPLEYAKWILEKIEK